MTAALEASEGQGAGARGPVVAGFLVIGLFFGGFGGWAALAPLQSAAIAPGLVSVDTNRKTIQHLEGGIVGEILVRDGDRVRAGQVLIRLDETLPRTSLELLKGRSMASRALEARLIAERDGADAIRFPELLTAAGADPQVAEMINGQINIFAARRNSVAGQVKILGQRIAQFREEINGLKGQIASEVVQHGLIAEEIKDVTGLYEKGLARRPRLLALQRQAAEIEGSRSQNMAAIARVEQNIAEARLHISELRTSTINEVVQELRDVQTEMFELAERIAAAEDILTRTELRAPIEGTVVGLQVHTPGGVIAPGEPLLDIVPADDRLVVEARVDPSDIDVVHPGLPSQVRFTALNQRNLAPVDGTVTAVSADRIVDDRTGESYYLTRVELDDGFAEALGGVPLYPGMQAEVMIVTGERSALDYLIRPFARSLNRAFRED